MRSCSMMPSGWQPAPPPATWRRSEEHTSELQSPCNLVCRLLLEKTKQSSLVLTAGGITSRRRWQVAGVPLVALHRVRAPAAAITGSLPRTDEPSVFFFFNDTATTEIYTLSLHDALPI